MTSTAVPPTSESLVTFIWLFWYLHGTLLTVKAVNWGGIIRSWQRSALRWLLSLLTFKSPYAALILLYTSHLDYPQIYKSVLLYFRAQWVWGKVAWISKLNQHLRQSAGVWPGSNICINKSRMWLFLPERICSCSGNSWMKMLISLERHFGNIGRWKCGSEKSHFGSVFTLQRNTCPTITRLSEPDNIQFEVESMSRARFTSVEIEL